ncbi:hypothetical protein SAMN05421823_103178 [Catalinimonas alkaloidigena]|uniref:Uncharacterized protein n=2 Tax=Catalinimonas alkaloidigena TaxID=1075417 RepID=A0A1G9DM73_9BACT|nr:hypothetical protein SAMN05421823_103178 [Catalinimonas alkaloidigena]
MVLSACQPGNGPSDRPLILQTGTLPTTLSVPNTLRLSLKFVDDQGLASYDWAVQPVFDTLLFRSSPYGYPAYTFQVPLAGQIVDQQDSLVFSTDEIPGTYQLSVVGIDAEGARSDSLTHTLTLENPRFPVLTLRAPINSRTQLSTSVGDTLVARGTVSDQEGLSSLALRLFVTRDSTPVAAYHHTFPVENLTTYDFVDSLFLQADSLTADSLYTLEVTVRDLQQQEIKRWTRLKISHP